VRRRYRKYTYIYSSNYSVNKNAKPNEIVLPNQTKYITNETE